ncbi:DsbA family protein [Pararhodobacter sp.]|uniref:DsbA family protein n=1 Tax=Pararhodobacter sp. TaxID=2127056 RepID=UPI002B0039DE|nr:DsbA family protein [Pararhodobacter sp.]
MTRLPFPVAAFSAALFLAASPLAAQTAPMSDEDRAAFGAEVRAYLLANPEVIFEAVAEFERRTAEAQSGMDNTLVEINAEEIFADGHSWVGGNLDGDLTLVEFMDYRCSFCRRAQPQMAEFLSTDGNVRLIIKEFPILGPQSEVMSRFAVAVHQQGTDAQYEEAHERLMAWEGDFTETSARLLAEELGASVEDVIGAMNSDAVSAVLTANRELAQRLQISGTPTFVMGGLEGGELLRGYMPADEMQGIAAQLRG